LAQAEFNTIAWSRRCRACAAPYAMIPHPQPPRPRTIFLQQQTALPRGPGAPESQFTMGNELRPVWMYSASLAQTNTISSLRAAPKAHQPPLHRRSARAHFLAARGEQEDKRLNPVEVIGGDGQGCRRPQREVLVIGLRGRPSVTTKRR